MIESWVYRQTQDKLKIFVSSRLVECKEERKVVKKAIDDLNHQPVLFEHIGARAYSARDLYLSRLRDSQAMIAIYRLGYGYVDTLNGMEISGLEEEFRFAEKENIDTLFYVWNDRSGRESRLTTLIDDVRKNNATTPYDDPAQLYSRVKDDLSALITDKFLFAISHSGVLKEGPSTVSARTLENVGIIIPRDSVLEKIIDLMSDNPILCVYGEGGIGKTNIAAQLSDRIEAVFVRTSGLSPKEVFAVCADVVRGKTSSDVTPFSTLDGARLAAAAAWAEQADITLIVDECDYVQELLDTIDLGGGVSDTKRVIYTSRVASSDYPSIEVPQLTRDEIKKFFANNAIFHDNLVEVSEGNPLKLQHMMLMHGSDSVQEFPRFNGSAQEILTYLALSPMPLSAEQLIELKSDNSYSIASLANDVEKLNKLVDDSPRGYRIIHGETASLISNEISKSPQRFNFFMNRLIQLVVRYGFYRYAYELSKEIGDGSEKLYAAKALREAATLGDWRLGVSLAEQMIHDALDTESKYEALHLMISLIYPLELMGDVRRADEIIERARTLAVQLGESAQLNLKEAEISSKARRTLQAGDVEGLEDIYDEYSQRGMEWDQARIGLELSAIYISARKYDKAVEYLRPAYSIFKDLGDEYGVDLTQRNLVSALSEMPGNEDEAEKIFNRISERITDESDYRRQRAWLCNVLVRRYRRAGRYDEAMSLAKEAIDIADALGDESLRALNLVNLGNVLRDSDKPLDAIEAYEAAAISSKSCGRLDIESDASRLVAGVYNDFSETGDNQYRRSKAKYYAQYSIALVRGSVNHDSLAHSYMELSEAQSALGETENSVRAMFDAASEFYFLQNEEGLSYALMEAVAMSLEDYPEIYLSGISTILGVDVSDTSQSFVEHFLDLIVPIINKTPKKVMIRVLGSHLNEIRNHLDEPLRRGLASILVGYFCNFVDKNGGDAQDWRVLYSAIAIVTLLKDTPNLYFQHRLASSISSYVPDIFVREEDDGSRVWTLVLNMNHRVTVSIQCLDESIASNIAAFSLSLFLKAFEHELVHELIGNNTNIDELLINIASFDEMPESLRNAANKTMALDEVLSEQPCAVTRPTDYTENSPTIVILSKTFLKDLSFNNEKGNSLQLLFGLTLVEIVYQLLRGNVEIETLRPKIISLVQVARP